MGIVKAFAIEGLEIYFNSSDHHPPHFHVESTDWQVRVYIDSSSSKHGLKFDYKEPKNPPKNFRGITRKQRKQLLQMVINHRAELLLEWQQKVCVREII